MHEWENVKRWLLRARTKAYIPMYTCMYICLCVPHRAKNHFYSRTLLRTHLSTSSLLFFGGEIFVSFSFLFLFSFSFSFIFHSVHSSCISSMPYKLLWSVYSCGDVIFLQFLKKFSMRRCFRLSSSSSFFESHTIRSKNELLDVLTLFFLSILLLLLLFIRLFAVWMSVCIVDFHWFLFFQY